MVSAFVGLMGLAATGCVSTQDRGDHAMEMGRHDVALDYYEEEIATGSRDPDLYTRAARAANAHGAFAKAERYYSQALRYGGGNDVARELAEFYIQTSNFTQAVKVLQYLVSSEEDDDKVQPLYTNIGTALMYAGSYMDAEFYLLLAQQMDPADPIPYINLGVLYDRHLRNRPKALKFYECYADMSTDQSRNRQVRTRLREIHSQGRVDTSRVDLTCGEEYRMAQPEELDLTEVYDLGIGDGTFDEDGEGPTIRRAEDVPVPGPESAPQEAGATGDDDEASAEPGVIEESGGVRIVEAPGEEEMVEEDPLMAANEAYAAGRYDEAVAALEAMPQGQRELPHRELLGKAYRQVGRYEESAQALEGVLEERPNPTVAQFLIGIYDELQDQESKDELCDRFSGWPDYTDALAACDE